METETSKWNRLTNPTCVEDYGISVSLTKLMEESPILVVNEILPYIGIAHAKNPK